MSRKRIFLAGLAAAVVTFGALFATLGSARFNKSCHPCHAMHHCCMHESQNAACGHVSPDSGCSVDPVEK